MRSEKCSRLFLARWWVARSLALGLLFGGHATFAQTADGDVTRAREAFSRGVESFKNGKYAQALEAFHEANRIKPNPVVLYNIGQAEAELGKPAAAVAHFEEYLRDAKNIPGPRRVEVKKEIARLKKQTVAVSIDSNVPGARVVMDGIFVGLAPLGRTVPVDPGEHKIEVSRDGYEPFAATFSAKSGKGQRVTATLKRVEEKPTPPPPPPPVIARVPVAEKPAAKAAPGPGPVRAPASAREPSPAAAATPATVSQSTSYDHAESHGLRPRWFWTGVGVTGALAITTTVLGSIALHRSNEYNDPLTPLSRKQQILDSGPTLAHATDALLITTVVSAGVTTFLFFKTDWHAAPIPGGVALGRTF